MWQLTFLWNSATRNYLNLGVNGYVEPAHSFEIAASASTVSHESPILLDMAHFGAI